MTKEIFLYCWSLFFSQETVRRSTHQLTNSRRVSCILSSFLFPYFPLPLPPPSPSLTHLLTRLVILGSLCCSGSPSLIPFVPYFRSQALFQRLDSKRPILVSLLVLNLCFKSQAKQGTRHLNRSDSLSETSTHSIPTSFTHLGLNESMSLDDGFESQ